jgi:CheY-like chemotaxis protein
VPIYDVPQKKTVMVCDDDRDLRLMFSMALGSKYNIILADSGKNCIERFLEEKKRGNKIHLILLDYRLGDMFGDSVARKIKEYDGVKIILISAYELDYELVKELRVDKYIATSLRKPIHLDDLIELLENTMSSI